MTRGPFWDGRFWIIDADGEPTKVDLFVFAVALMERPRGFVLHSDYPIPEVHVSTVLLAVNLITAGPLWETKIFGGLLDGWGLHYHDRESASRGHAVALARAIASVRAINAARESHTLGATHECNEWLIDGVCQVCGEALAPQ